MQFLDAPAVHKLSDHRIFACRRASQLLVVHVSEVFDVAHVNEHGYECRIDWVILNLVPADAVDVLSR